MAKESYRGPLEQIDPCCWRIPKDYKPGMRVDGLTARAWGEPLDRTRHDLQHEVKAITYHGLRVEPAPDGWLAEVIVDI